MLYTIASAGWLPGYPLTPSSARAGLFRSRAEAEAVDDRRELLAVALRYDATRGVVVSLSPTARAQTGPWVAPAIVDDRGSLTVLAPIPPGLVRVIGPAQLRAHPEAPRLVPRPHSRPAATRPGGIGRHAAADRTRPPPDHQPSHRLRYSHIR